MRGIVVLILGVVLFSYAQAQASPSIPAAHDDWIFAQEVAYNENHDPSMIWLADGRELKVIYDGQLTWEVVELWTPGRKMTLAYSAAKGCVLIDVATGHQLPVIAGWHDDHPLDLLLKEDLSSADTTVDMVDAYVGSGDRWEIEIRRLYALLLEMPIVPTETKEALRAEQTAWETFRAAHLNAAGPCGVRSGPRPGSAGALLAFRRLEVIVVAKNKAKHLVRVVAGRRRKPSLKRKARRRIS
jgi:hypothetical protein